MVHRCRAGAEVLRFSRGDFALCRCKCAGAKVQRCRGMQRWCRSGAEQVQRCMQRSSGRGAECRDGGAEVLMC